MIQTGIGRLARESLRARGVVFFALIVFGGSLAESCTCPLIAARHRCQTPARRFPYVRSDLQPPVSSLQPAVLGRQSGT